MKGATESDLVSLTETLTIANIMEQARKQIIPKMIEFLIQFKNQNENT